MKRNSGTDYQDQNCNQGRVQPSRVTRSRIIRFGLLALLMTFALGNQRCPLPDREPTLPCRNVEVYLPSGTCKVFENPCSDHRWSTVPGGEGFALDDVFSYEGARYEDFSIVTTHNGDAITRQLCLAAGTAPFHPAPAVYRYARGDEYGRGSFFVTNAAPLIVSAKASPATVAAGSSSQLTATVSDGFPPYSYAWTPSDSLDRSDVANPIATPAVTTTYTVVATETAGFFAATSTSFSVTVFVSSNLTVTATPGIIHAGDTSQLNVVVQGGSPPYTFSWTPTLGLDDPLRQNPLTRPSTTTTYEVSVTDSLGAISAGSVTVSVVPTPPPPTASFVYSVRCCPSVFLDGSASTGDIVSYTWDLSWTSKSPDGVTTGLIAQFPIREIDFGTITLTVTDSLGRTATTTRNF